MACAKLHVLSISLCLTHTQAELCWGGGVREGTMSLIRGAQHSDILSCSVSADNTYSGYVSWSSCLQDVDIEATCFRSCIPCEKQEMLWQENIMHSPASWCWLSRSTCVLQQPPTYWHIEESERSQWWLSVTTSTHLYLSYACWAALWPPAKEPMWLICHRQINLRKSHFITYSFLSKNIFPITWI